MKFRSILRSEAATILRASFELPTGELSIDDLAQWIRLEVLHHAPITRSNLLRRILGQSDMIEVREEALIDAFDQLARRGDVLMGKGGQVYSTPCCLVSEETGSRGVLLGTVARQHLKTFPGSVTEDGVVRLYEADNPESLLTWLDILGGRMISSEMWSGMYRAPRADQTFLAQCAEGIPSSFDAAECRAFCPRTWKWQSGDSGVNSTLWRKSGDLRFSEYFFGRQERAVSLSYDDSVRTQHALARRESPVTVSYRTNGTACSVEFPCRLPWAEYRHLSLFARAQNERAFVFEANDWSKLTTVLEERLGLEFQEVSS